MREPERVERLALIDAVPLLAGLPLALRRAPVAPPRRRRAGDGLDGPAGRRPAAARGARRRGHGGLRRRHPAGDPAPVPQRAGGPSWPPPAAASAPSRLPGPGRPGASAIRTSPRASPSATRRPSAADRGLVARARAIGRGWTHRSCTERHRLPRAVASSAFRSEVARKAVLRPEAHGRRRIPMPVAHAPCITHAALLDRAEIAICSSHRHRVNRIRRSRPAAAAPQPPPRLASRRSHSADLASTRQLSHSSSDGMTVLRAHPPRRPRPRRSARR